MKSHEARLALSAGLALAATLACKAPAGDAAPAPSAATSAAAPASATPVAAKPSSKPWYAGAFSGAYEAKLQPVDVKVGAIREWAKDDGKAASGAGKLTLQIDDAGIVDGTSEGALGAGHVSGKVEDDTLRLQLLPNDDSAMRGVLVASRDGDGFKGSIEASSGDSTQVRQAPIELKKQTN